MIDELPPLPMKSLLYETRDRFDDPLHINGYTAEQMQAYARAALAAAPQPQPVQEPVAWSERIKELADQYAIECVEFSKGIPNGAHSMSPIAVKAGDTRLALHSAIDTGERFIRAIESATLASQVERAPQPQPVQESEYCDPSSTIYKLAEMVMSDCGCSSDHQRLLDRIAARIQSHIDTTPQAQPLPVQPTANSGDAEKAVLDRMAKYVSTITQSEIDDADGDRGITSPQAQAAHGITKGTT